MKKYIKIIILLCILLILSYSLLGCRKEAQAPQYISEVIYSEEALDTSLAIGLKLYLPSEGRTILENVFSLPTKGIFQHNKLTVTKEWFPTRSSKDIANLLGMTAQEYNENFNVQLYNYYIYEDVTLYFLEIPEDHDYKGVTVTYAGQKVIIEDRDGTPYISSWTPMTIGYKFTTRYKGRVGNKYYFGYGYYDLNEHKIYATKTDADNPNIAFNNNDNLHDIGYKISDTLKADSNVSEHFKDDATNYMVCGSTLVGERFYVMLGTNNRHFEYGEGGVLPYSGETLYFAVFDNVTYKVLYLEKIHIDNYWCYEAFFYHYGKDGELYMPYLKDDSNIY